MEAGRVPCCSQSAISGARGIQDDTHKPFEPLGVPRFLEAEQVLYSPKEFKWAIGVCLLVITILLRYTGYLLPWDQLSFWGISVGTNMVRAVPFGFGEKISFLLLGGNIVGENALIRFYVLYCFIIPVASMVLMGIHFWRVRKDGGV